MYVGSIGVTACIGGRRLPRLEREPELKNRIHGSGEPVRRARRDTEYKPDTTWHGPRGVDVQVSQYLASVITGRDHAGHEIALRTSSRDCSYSSDRVATYIPKSTMHPPDNFMKLRLSSRMR